MTINLYDGYLLDLVALLQERIYELSNHSKNSSDLAYLKPFQETIEHIKQFGAQRNIPFPDIDYKAHHDQDLWFASRVPIPSEVCQSYLIQLITLTKTLAYAAKKEADRELDNADKQTYLMGYHEIINLMQQQAMNFEIPLKDLSLDDIDPEKDLL